MQGQTLDVTLSAIHQLARECVPIVSWSRMFTLMQLYAGADPGGVQGVQTCRHNVQALSLVVITIALSHSVVRPVVRHMLSYSCRSLWLSQHSRRMSVIFEHDDA
jgi:hypothetical protein